MARSRPCSPLPCRLLTLHGCLRVEQVVFRIAVEASEALFIPMYFMFLCVIVYSSLLYYIEKPVTVSCLMKNERWKLANFTRASHQYAYCDAGIATYVLARSHHTHHTRHTYTTEGA